MAKTRPPLTNKRRTWAEQRGGATFKGSPLQLPAAVQARYSSSLERLVAEMFRVAEREVRRLFEADAADAAMDASLASQARILTNALTKRFDELFSKRAYPLAEQMVNGANKSSTQQLTTSLKEMSGGLTLKTTVLNGPINEIIKASVAENVSLIKNISEQATTAIQGAVMRGITNGNGLADILPAIQRQHGITTRRARNIAGDQTRKAYNNINKARMQSLGVKRFEWLHSGGGAEPRRDHIAMSGNIYSFDDPPIIDPRTGERGIPGQAINCRCRMIPVLEFEGD